MDINSLKNDLKSGKDISTQDIEHLAAAIERYIYDDYSLDEIAAELDLLFACYERLPGSVTVQRALCKSCRYYTDTAGEEGELSKAMAYTERLKLLAYRDERTSLLRCYAHMLALNIINFPEVKSIESELEKLVQDYNNDPIMPAMLAWAKRSHLWHAQDHEVQGYFDDLADYFKKHPENILIAGIYAAACSERFEHLITDNPDKANNEYLPELQRLLRDYGERYRRYNELDVYDFPAYGPEWIDYYFTSALSSAAANDAEQDDLPSLRKHYAMVTEQLSSAEALTPEILDMYQSAEQQMLSNLALLYGRDGNYAEATQAIDKLRKYADYESLSDALYNLITQYANDDIIGHRVQIKALSDELEAVAAQADDMHGHTRYVMALYNISGQLEEKGIPHMGMWNLLYDYSMRHTVNADMAWRIAQEEMALIGSVDNLPDALMHRDKARAICTHQEYCEDKDLLEWIAAADYNLLIVALPNKAVALADEMLKNLIAMADEYAYDDKVLEWVVLRLAKGAVMLANEYGNTNDINKEEKVYTESAKRLIPHAENAEISTRLTKMALNLCIDLYDAHRTQQIQRIYNELSGLLPLDQESTVRINKIKTLLKG